MRDVTSPPTARHNFGNLRRLVSLSRHNSSEYAVYSTASQPLPNRSIAPEASQPLLRLSLSLSFSAAEAFSGSESQRPISKVRAAACGSSSRGTRGTFGRCSNVRVFEMTSCAPKWNVHLALVLVCQMVRLIEGHPRAFAEESSAFAGVSPDAGSPSAEDTLSISRMIEEAYENQELMRPQQWSQRTDDGDGEGTQDTSEQQEPSSDGTMQYRKRKLLQVPNIDTSMYRGPDVSMHRNANMPLHRNADMPLHRNSDEKIIFPDGRISPQMSVQPASASACRRSTFCENVADYPRQLVNAAIARNASLRFLESVDPMPDVEQRIDVTDESSSLCRFREQVVYPQTAQNKQKQWLFIVNQDDLKQGIRIEVCSNDGQECNLIKDFAEGYKTTCKQKFIYRELAAVGSDGDIVKDQFRFPSSCCCHVRFIGDPTIRLGLSLSANRTQYK